MKSSYSKRWGKERTKHAHKSTNSSATRRRKGAYDRLSKQLKAGGYTNVGGHFIPLYEGQAEKINQELTSLKERL